VNNARADRPKIKCMTRVQLSAGLLFFVAIACALRADSSAAKLINQRIHTLRSLADDTRAAETRKLALEIRALPDDADKLPLALSLSGVATEGDFGRDTLRDVAVSLSLAIREHPDAPDSAFDELARLVHYEHVDLTVNDSRFRSAMARLDATDEIRAHSEFTLKDLTGKSWSLKELQGRIILVNFWATWCPPCRKEMPDLESLHNRFSSKGLVIVAISDEDDAKVRPFIAAGKFTYPILLDPESTIKKRFLIQGIPQTLIYDRSGKLVAQSSDMRTMKQFLEMLKQAGLGN
jgi:thiol-disulfide isomerase/thioredoxin